MQKEMTATAAGVIFKKWGLVLLGMIGSFFSPIKWLLIASFILVIIDWQSGIRASRKKGLDITDMGLRKTLTKAKDYSVVIIVAHIMSLIFFKDVKIDFASVAAAYIGLIEWKSFCQNMKIVTDNEVWDRISNIIPEVNIFKKGGKS